MSLVNLMTVISYTIKYLLNHFYSAGLQTNHFINTIKNYFTVFSTARDIWTWQYNTSLLYRILLNNQINENEVIVVQ